MLLVCAALVLGAGDDDGAGALDDAACVCVAAAAECDFEIGAAGCEAVVGAELTTRGALRCRAACELGCDAGAEGTTVGSLAGAAL